MAANDPLLIEYDTLATALKLDPRSFLAHRRHAWVTLDRYAPWHHFSRSWSWELSEVFQPTDASPAAACTNSIFNSQLCRSRSARNSR